MRVVSNHLLYKVVLYHTKRSDIGQPIWPKPFVTVLERTVKSNRDTVTAYNDHHDTVDRS